MWKSLRLTSIGISDTRKRSQGHECQLSVDLGHLCLSTQSSKQAGSDKTRAPKDTQEEEGEKEGGGEEAENTEERGGREAAQEDRGKAEEEKEKEFQEAGSDVFLTEIRTPSPSRRVCDRLSEDAHSMSTT